MKIGQMQRKLRQNDTFDSINTVVKLYFFKNKIQLHSSSSFFRAQQVTAELRFFKYDFTNWYETHFSDMNSQRILRASDEP